ncbi:MAG: diacylglycerol kinase family lipid kinase [Hespellia sp.]|nr:diacylglycerol kinase family lipid kinase [Hespellia sp.]
MYTFIVNPHARSGLGAQVWDQIESVLKSRHVPYEVHFTRYQKHATQLVRDITSDQKSHTIVVLGGDGTINEVLNGITEMERFTLGYIPIGSSNDFARGLGLPTDPLAALEQILNSKCIQKMDVGVLSYQNKVKHFAVSTGLGFDAAICHEAVVSRLKVALNRIKLGKLTYVGIALNRLFLDKPVHMTVSIDGQEPFSFERTYFAAVMNQPYEGGGFKFCPEAKPDDGILDVVVINNLSKKKVLALLPTAYSGKHIHFSGVTIFRGRKIEIHSDKALPVHTDGEPVFLQKDICVTLAPSQINVISPERR